MSTSTIPNESEEVAVWRESLLEPLLDNGKVVRKFDLDDAAARAATDAETVGFVESFQTEWNEVPLDFSSFSADGGDTVVFTRQNGIANDTGDSEERLY